MKGRREISAAARGSDVGHPYSKVAPIFYERLNAEDRLFLKRHMEGRRFDEGIVLGVMTRCRWGYPQVILCCPLSGIRPFPTIFWLVCPYLVRACSALESAGGVGDLERKMGHDLSEWISYSNMCASLRLAIVSSSTRRFLRSRRRGIWHTLRRSGLGGIAVKDRVTLKCLHLQVASWLALGEHPGAVWLEKAVGPRECEAPSYYRCSFGEVTDETSRRHRRRIELGPRPRGGIYRRALRIPCERSLDKPAGSRDWGRPICHIG
ncbi:MAG TPA: DUF501 domain-containing protein [Thermosynergistes sp.]|nr:DUF501 domain-containing protein [Thermosynergistes sp.]